MKTLSRHRHALACLFGLATAISVFATERVGIYDSRVLAYACFNSPEHLAALRVQMAEARAAQEQGDEGRYRVLEAKLKAEQQRAHLQVFSTEPVPEALAELGPRIEAVRRETGVSRLVSKWDTDAMREVANADQVDVTAALIRDVNLSPAQRRIARDIERKLPLPLTEARRLAAAGKL